MIAMVVILAMSAFPLWLLADGHTTVGWFFAFCFWPSTAYVVHLSIRHRELPQFAGGPVMRLNHRRRTGR